MEESKVSHNNKRNQKEQILTEKLNDSETKKTLKTTHLIFM